MHADCLSGLWTGHRRKSRVCERYPWSVRNSRGHAWSPEAAPRPFTHLEGEDKDVFGFDLFLLDAGRSEVDILAVASVMSRTEGCQRYPQ